MRIKDCFLVIGTYSLVYGIINYFTKSVVTWEILLFNGAFHLILFMILYVLDDGLDDREANKK